ncbi:MAG: tetratricopeptide repeat protein [bacterium]
MRRIFTPIGIIFTILMAAIPADGAYSTLTGTINIDTADALQGTANISLGWSTISFEGMDLSAYASFDFPVPPKTAVEIGTVIPGADLGNMGKSQFLINGKIRFTGPGAFDIPLFPGIAGGVNRLNTRKGFEGSSPYIVLTEDLSDLKLLDLVSPKVSGGFDFGRSAPTAALDVVWFKGNLFEPRLPILEYDGAGLNFGGGLSIARSLVIGGAATGITTGNIGFSIGISANTSGLWGVAPPPEEEFVIRKSARKEGKIERGLNDLIVRGEGEERAGNYDKAIKIYIEAADSYPNSTWLDEVYYFIGRNYDRLKEYNEAIKWYHRVGEEFPLSPWSAHGLLGEARSLEKLERYEDAKRIYEGILRSRPKGEYTEEVMFKIGKMSENLGDFNAARKAYSDLESVFPETKFKAQEFVFYRTVPLGVESTIELADKTSIVFPAGEITGNTPPILKIAFIRPENLPPAKLEGVKPTNIAREFSLDIGKKEFSKPLKISIPYGDAQSQGMRDENLRIYSWDGKNWNEEDSSPLLERKVVEARVKRLSIFRIMGRVISEEIKVAAEKPPEVGEAPALKAAEEIELPLETITPPEPTPPQPTPEEIAAKEAKIKELEGEVERLNALVSDLTKKVEEAKAAPPPAPKEVKPKEDVERAQFSFQRGKKNYDDGKYKEAIMEFQRAIEIAPTSDIAKEALYWIKQAIIKLQQRFLPR